MGWKAGAAIANSANSLLTITNCTISGNGDDYWNMGGGGVCNSGQLLVQNSTIHGNSSYSGSGGLTSEGDFKTIVKNSIIAGNSIASSAEGTPDCNSISSLDYSVIGNTSGCTIPAGRGNMLNVDPLLGPLANNGGKTRTHALLPGSAALDFGSPATPGSGGNACVKTDQRGVGRPQNGRCDMGAYEYWPGHPHGLDQSDEGEEAESEMDQP